MSILIKGMEMPPNCYECPLMLSVFVFEGDSDICSITEGGCTAESRPPHCPLTEIPPHGDLIDRDALMKDGWLSLWKRVDYMGGYAIHDVPLINPSIPVVLESEGDDGR